MFRAQLILHEKVREVFEGSLRLARQSGYLKKRGMRVALDTTCILGRGAVKDTYNLLADGVKLLRALATVANIAVGEWAEGQGYERYFGSSIKGEATIDRSDRKARRTGSSNCCVPWRPWRTSRSGNGPKVRGMSGTSGPASRARRRLTGRTAKRGGSFWES